MTTPGYDAEASLSDGRGVRYRTWRGSIDENELVVPQQFGDFPAALCEIACQLCVVPRSSQFGLRVANRWCVICSRCGEDVDLI